MKVPRRKKDFKLREEIVLEFEKYAPARQQTAIVEQLITDWVAEQKYEEQASAVRRAYERGANAKKRKPDTRR